MLQKRIMKIVFTGGPCAGKTTGITYCQDLLRERGYKVFVVPEAATLMNMGGGTINFSQVSYSQMVNFQKTLMKFQMDLEDRFTELAQIENNAADKESVILCDRGVMDGSAFVDPEQWQIIIDEMNQNVVQLRDKRYDAVIHLVTAAYGAEKYYNLGNKARYEITLDLARQSDNKLINAWQGHPYWLIIDNSEKGFQQKMKKVGESVLRLVGSPSNISFYKKYLISLKDLKFPKDLKVEKFVIEDVVIQTDDVNKYKRIRKRIQNDNISYSLLEKFIGNKDNKIELTRRITARDYREMYELRDSNKQDISKIKYILVWKNVVYNIEEYNINGEKFAMVLIQSQRGLKEVDIPSFIETTILKEITDDSRYQHYKMHDEKWVLPDNNF